jgi:hypothetical protein
MATGVQLQRPEKDSPMPSDMVDWMARTPHRSLVGSRRSTCRLLRLLSPRTLVCGCMGLALPPRHTLCLILGGATALHLLGILVS